MKAPLSQPPVASDSWFARPPVSMAGSADALSSPTLTGHTTLMGVILGTAAFLNR